MLIIDFNSSEFVLPNGSWRNGRLGSTAFGNGSAVGRAGREPGTPTTSLRRSDCPGTAVSTGKGIGALGTSVGNVDIASTEWRVERSTLGVGLLDGWVELPTTGIGLLEGWVELLATGTSLSEG